MSDRYVLAVQGQWCDSRAARLGLTNAKHTMHTEAVPPEWAFTVHEALQKAAEIILHARAVAWDGRGPAEVGDDDGRGGGFGPTLPPSPYHRTQSGSSSSSSGAAGGGGSSSNRRFRVSVGSDRVCVSPVLV